MYENTLRKAFSHVGIYTGDGKLIHSPRSGGQAHIEDMSDNYLGQAFQRCAPRQPRDAGFQHPLQRKLIAPTAAVAVTLFPRLGFERDKPCLSPS